MKLLAVSVGQPQRVLWRDREIFTSIYKSPVSGSVQVTWTNIEGDRQSDLTVHGGVNKAVYAYSHDTYPWWEQTLALDPLPFGAFGENLTIDQLDETKIFVGDVFALGGCLLEAVEPRAPCFKLGIKFGIQEILKTFNDFNRPGIYFRVKREGAIKAGDNFTLVSSDEKVKASIEELFQFLKRPVTITQSRVHELLQIKALTDRWRNKFQKVADG